MYRAGGGRPNRCDRRRWALVHRPQKPDEKLTVAIGCDARRAGETREVAGDAPGAVSPPTEGPSMPDAPTPATALPDDGATARRGLAGRHLAPRGVAAIALAAAVTTAVSGCGDDSTADASTSTIAPSDMSRIAAGNTPRSSSTDPSTSLRSAASSAPATSRSASVASSAPGTTSKAGAAAVVIPDAAKAHTKDGAKAFVKFYWETVLKLDAAPEDGVLETLSATDCRSCVQQASSVHRLVADKAHAEIVGAKSFDFKVRADSVPDSVIVTFEQRSSGGQRVSADGKKSALAALNRQVTSRADWSGTGWKLGASGADDH